MAVAVAVCAPLLALPLSFVGQGDALDQIAADLLPDALRASIVLAAGVGAGTLVLGAALAALVSFYDFPDGAGWTGRSSCRWPCRPTSFSCCWASTTSRTRCSRRCARSWATARLPEVRSTAGAITVLTLVLYPYVYVLGRTAFLDQSRETLEAARTLGLSHRRAVLRVALPLARPALAAGAALAVMEALADFGAVNLLNYRR